jgi:hypothetical protein
MCSACEQHARKSTGSTKASSSVVTFCSIDHLIVIVS